MKTNHVKVLSEVTIMRRKHVWVIWKTVTDIFQNTQTDLEEVYDDKHEAKQVCEKLNNQYSSETIMYYVKKGYLRA